MLQGEKIRKNILTSNIDTMKMFPPGTFLWKPRLSSHVVDVELQVASLHDSQYWGKLKDMSITLESIKVETRNFQNNEML